MTSAFSAALRTRSMHCLRASAAAMTLLAAASAQAQFDPAKVQAEPAAVLSLIHI